MKLIPWLFLAFQAAVVLGSLLGYGIFARHPERLVRLGPEAVRFYAWAFQGFAVLNMSAAACAVIAFSLLHNPFLVAVRSLAAVYLISLTSELLGTSFGIPFGAYSYTELLGPKWLDQVPVLIPFSWFTMAWAVWLIARHRMQPSLAVAAAALLLVAWDLVLDPAMSAVTPYWVWEREGGYYGMPLSNFLGWALTGLALQAVLALLAPNPRGGTRFPLAVYLVNLALPLGFCILDGYVGAASAGAAIALVAIGLCLPTKLIPLQSGTDGRPAGSPGGRGLRSEQ